MTSPEGNYLAVGKEKVEMRVYWIDIDGPATPILTNISFPWCFRFFYAYDISETRKRSLDWIKEHYGDLPKLRKALDEEPPFTVLPDDDPKWDLINGRT